MDAGLAIPLARSALGRVAPVDGGRHPGGGGADGGEFFSDRLKSGLERDARQLLGGDAVVVSDNPPTAAWLDQARALGLEQALTLGFPTMGRAPDAQGGATRLVALKAVDQGYRCAASCA